MFLRNNFSPVSFSSISFNGARKEGHSGYWRLFFMQLQEEADKKSETAAVVKEPAKVQDKVMLVKKPTKRAKPAAVAKEETEKVPPFRPLPMYETRPDEPSYLRQMWDITAELRIMVAALHRINVKFNESNVANDEDDIELLLLVA